MAQRKNLSDVSVATAMNLIGSKWKMLILKNLLSGTLRFKHLQYGIDGISAKVLTENLRSLEEDGLIEREVYAEIPMRVEYSLTAMGEQIQPVVDALAKFGQTYRKQKRLR